MSNWKDLNFNGRGLKFTSPLPDQSDLTIVCPPTVKILDLGCGYGRVLKYLREKGFSDLTGVDISPDLIQAAKNNCSSAKYYIQDFESFSVDGKFDSIFLMGVIEYILTDKRQKIFFKKVSDLLNDNGHVFLETFSWDWRSNWKKYLQGFLNTAHWGRFHNILKMECHHQTDSRLWRLLENEFEIVKNETKRFTTWSGSVCPGHIYILKKKT